MDFSFDPEQQATAELAGQILRDGATMERMRALEQGDGPRFDRDLWQKLAEAGLVGVAVDETYGGAGLGFLELALVSEQVGRTTAPVPFIETAVLGALPLQHFGSDAQKQAWLPGVCRGEIVLTAALTEPQAELDDPQTTATPDGDGFRLHGTKISVPFGQVADRILVPACTSAGEIGVFLLDPEAPGVRREALVTTSRQPEVVLELADVAVPSDALLGDLAHGRSILEWIALRGTAALCSLALGVAEAAVDLTSEYTKARKQFGQPIATFQAVGQRAADAFVDTEGIRLTSWQAAWRIATGLDATREVAVAKVWAAEAGQRVVHAAVHLHGGMGVDRDYPLHRHFLYAKTLELQLGGGTAQLRRLGRLLADEAA